MVSVDGGLERTNICQTTCQTLRAYLYEHYSEFRPQMDELKARCKVYPSANNELRYTMLALQVVFAGEHEQGVSP